MVPVPSHVDRIVGDNYEMESPWWDCVFASRTQIFLHSLIRLNGVDRYPKIAQAMTARIAIAPKTTMAMSTTVFLCSRNGLNPIR